MATIFGSGSMNNLAIGAIDHDHTPTSRTILRTLDSSPTLHITHHYTSTSEAMAALRRGEIYGFVEIPEGATLRYTTDGTTPSLTNGDTSDDGAFYVENTTTYRFALFQEGMLPSQVVTRSYIYKDKDYSLPIISVVTDPINLYDDMLGVYVRGTNGRPGNGESVPCNWNMDWDRPVNFEYITPDGGMVINQEVDFAMCGGWSRSWNINPVHSFKLKAGKIY
jgi:hypothetical protein